MLVANRYQESYSGISTLLLSYSLTSLLPMDHMHLTGLSILEECLRRSALDYSPNYDGCPTELQWNRLGLNHNSKLPVAFLPRK